MTYTVTLAFGRAALPAETVTVTGRTADQVRNALEMALQHNFGFPGDPVTLTITPDAR